MNGKKITKEKAEKWKNDYHWIWDYGYHWENRSTINERGTNSASSVCVSILFLNLGGNYMGIKNIFTCFISFSVSIIYISLKTETECLNLTLGTLNGNL